LSFYIASKVAIIRIICAIRYRTSVQVNQCRPLVSQIVSSKRVRVSGGR